MGEANFYYFTCLNHVHKSVPHLVATRTFKTIE